MPKVTIQADRAAAVADLIAQGKSQLAAAAITGVPRRSVRRIIEGLGPELNELRELRRDAMLAGWQDAWFRAYAEMREGDEAGTLTPGDRQRLAIVMGIGTERALLLSGQPTAIVANVHEVRVSMPDLLSKLAAVGRVLGADRPQRSALPPSDVSRPGEAGDT